MHDTRERDKIAFESGYSVLFNKLLYKKRIPYSYCYCTAKATALRDRWYAEFVVPLNLSEVDIFDYGIFAHHWQIFVNGFCPCFHYEAAESAFDALEKKECMLFFQGSNPDSYKGAEYDAVYTFPQGGLLTVEDIRALKGIDLMIVDESFTWTYVSTHESNEGYTGQGPYFYRKG